MKTLDIVICRDGCETVIATVDEEGRVSGFPGVVRAIDETIVRDPRTGSPLPHRGELYLDALAGAMTDGYIRCRVRIAA